MAELSNELSIPRALRIFQRKRVPANCLATDTIGSCVYVTGPKIGQRYQVATADPSTTLKMPAIGVIVSKTSATECTVQLFGEVTGIYSGFVPGVTLYVGVAGQPSHTPGPISQVLGAAISTAVALLFPEFSKSAANYKIGRVLSSTLDPRVFTTGQAFQHEVGGITIEVFHNGRRLAQMLSNPSPEGDYFVAESIFGAGYDEVHLTSFTPSSNSRLVANYFV